MHFKQAKSEIETELRCSEKTKLSSRFVLSVRQCIQMWESTIVEEGGRKFSKDSRVAHRSKIDRKSWSGLQRNIHLVLYIPSANCAKR